MKFLQLFKNKLFVSLLSVGVALVVITVSVLSIMLPSYYSWKDYYDAALADKEHQKYLQTLPLELVGVSAELASGVVYYDDESPAPENDDFDVTAHFTEKGKEINKILFSNEFDISYSADFSSKGGIVTVSYTYTPAANEDDAEEPVPVVKTAEVECRLVPESERVDVRLRTPGSGLFRTMSNGKEIEIERSGSFFGPLSSTRYDISNATYLVNGVDYVKVYAYTSNTEGATAIAEFKLYCCILSSLDETIKADGRIRSDGSATSSAGNQRQGNYWLWYSETELFMKTLLGNKFSATANYYFKTQYIAKSDKGYLDSELSNFTANPWKPNLTTYIVSGISEGAGYTMSGNSSVYDGEGYTFTVSVNTEYATGTPVVAYTMGGTAQTPLTGANPDNGVYTFTISSVTGDIVITGVTGITATRYSVTLIKDSSAGYTMSGENSVDINGDYTFTLTADTEFVTGTPIVYYAIGGVAQPALTGENPVDGVYIFTISNVTGNLVVTGVGGLKLNVSLSNYLLACEAADVTPAFNSASPSAGTNATTGAITGTSGYGMGGVSDGNYLYITSKPGTSNLRRIYKINAETNTVIAQSGDFDVGNSSDNGRLFIKDGILYLISTVVYSIPLANFANDCLLTNDEAMTTLLTGDGSRAIFSAYYDADNERYAVMVDTSSLVILDKDGNVSGNSIAIGGMSGYSASSICGDDEYIYVSYRRDDPTTLPIRVYNWQGELLWTLNSAAGMYGNIQAAYLHNGVLHFTTCSWWSGAGNYNVITDWTATVDMSGLSNTKAYPVTGISNGIGYTMSGKSAVTEAADYTFTLTVDTALYEGTPVVAYTMNGAAQTALTGANPVDGVYTFTISNVTGSIAITGVTGLSVMNYSVSGIANGMGYTMAGESSVAVNGDYTFTLTVNTDDYEGIPVVAYTIGGAAQTALTGANPVDGVYTFTISNATGNIVITGITGVTALRYSVTLINSSAGYTMSGGTSVDMNGDYTFTLTVDAELATGTPVVNYTMGGAAQTPLTGENPVDGVYTFTISNVTGNLVVTGISGLEINMSLSDYLLACDAAGVTPAFNSASPSTGTNATTGAITGTSGYGMGGVSDGNYLYITSKPGTSNLRRIYKIDAETNTVVAQSGDFDVGNSSDNGRLFIKDGILYLISTVVYSIPLANFANDCLLTSDEAMTALLTGDGSRAIFSAYYDAGNERYAVMVDTGSLVIIDKDGNVSGNSITISGMSGYSASSICGDDEYIYVAYRRDDPTVLPIRVYNWQGELLWTLEAPVNTQGSMYGNIQAAYLHNGELHFMTCSWWGGANNYNVITNWTVAADMSVLGN